MKYQKIFLFIQRTQPLWSSVNKLLLSSLIIWLLTLQTTLALSPIPTDSRLAAEKNPISQNSAPPHITQAVRQDLSQRTKIPFNVIKIKSSQPMTWPDGCLGLAKSDEFCTQMLVQGWQIRVGNDKNTWVYRTDSQGKAIRLESQK